MDANAEVERVAARLERAIENGIYIREVAARANMSRSWIAKWRGGGVPNPGVFTLAAIDRALAELEG